MSPFFVHFLLFPTSMYQSLIPYKQSSSLSPCLFTSFFSITSSSLVFRSLLNLINLFILEFIYLSIYFFFSHPLYMASYVYFLSRLLNLFNPLLRMSLICLSLLIVHPSYHAFRLFDSFSFPADPSKFLLTLYIKSLYMVIPHYERFCVLKHFLHLRSNAQSDTFTIICVALNCSLS